jgi:hypothetical protein
MKNLFLFLVAISFFSSCAALTRYKCNREYAAKKGMEDANGGLSSMPGKLDGSSCEGEYSPSDFSKDYNYGFHQKKGEICQLSSAVAAGKTDGDLGNAAKPQKAKFNLCQDTKIFSKLVNSYDAEFNKAYCSSARASKAGEAQAQNWQEANFEAFAQCANAGVLKKTFSESYKKQLSQNCSLAEASRFGETEAAANRPMQEGMDRMQKCSSTGKGDFTKAFESSYLATKTRLESEQKLREAQEQEKIRQQKIQEFQNSVAVSNFVFANKSFSARCTVSPDRSFVQTEVDNRYGEQILIQGNWRMQYYGSDFQKITEDKTVEALLITPMNKKSFQKMTLPRDATFCRSEFIGI